MPPLRCAFGCPSAGRHRGAYTAEGSSSEMNFTPCIEAESMATLVHRAPGSGSSFVARICVEVFRDVGTHGRGDSLPTAYAKLDESIVRPDDGLRSILVLLDEQVHQASMSLTLAPVGWLVVHSSKFLGWSSLLMRFL